MTGPILSRRQFVRTGGSLVVGIGVVGSGLLKPGLQAASKTSADPSLVHSWFEIRADNTMTIHTGKCDFGQSTVTTAFKQIVADELYFPFESISDVVMGDTDRTPDGGVSAGFLRGSNAPNLRKAAAYTREALLDLAATKLGVARAQLSVKEGVVSGGGKQMTYGALVSGQELTLKIPVSGDLTAMTGLTVTGNPPLKPASEYTVIGKSYENYVTASKVAAKEKWVTDVRLPGMLHARVIHPTTLGSTLVSAGELDRKRFPNAQVIPVGNFVGVVAPTEWEAIGAAQQVAAATKWTDWKGLPGHARLHAFMRDASDWKTAPVTKGRTNKGDVAASIAGAAKTLKATYALPYWKHAPIGPTLAVADVKADGTVFVYTHNQNPSALRGQLAKMLGTTIDNVVVRTFAGPGHYGRSNGGNAGAEDEAVLLSKAVGYPVRVQWMRPDDLQWSTASPAAFADFQIALDAQGTIVGVQADHYMPAMQDDRPIGAVLAGLPTIGAPDIKPTGGAMGGIANGISDPWLYDQVPHVAEYGHGTFQLGQRESPIVVGVRDHSMRTPGQLQQNFPREMAMNEAAALAGVDPIEFRLKHTKDERLIGVLKAVRDGSGWQARKSPSPNATAAGSTPVKGQGTAVMLRSNSYWAAVCQVSVVPGTGKVTVEKYTIAVDPGIVVNPLQLKRQIQGGVMMGISHALHEEMAFDEGAITSRDWRTYPIATMADVPDLKVIILDNPKVGSYGEGSEAANAVAVSAVTAAVFDATGKMPRRTPLRPEYVKSILQA